MPDPTANPHAGEYPDRAASPAMPAAWRRLTRAELPQDTVHLARFLIGKLLVRSLAPDLLAGRIVETEAYLPGDAASHAFRGATERNRSMFLAHGHAYVYVIYGRSNMLNVSSEAPGIGAGVLFRALEPVLGLARMQQERGISPPADLARGPGRLAAALAINRTLDGVDLCGHGPLSLATDAHVPPPIGISERIGITRDAHRPLRFYVRGSKFVSGPARLRR
jgi:DNA-3-methyladenine glycosylase